MTRPDLDAPAREEREETDARLQAERDKVDVELAATRASDDHDADRVVELAQERADQTVRAARRQMDQDSSANSAGEESRRALEEARSVEDEVVAQERVEAVRALESEREERARALYALLRLEREATDEGLLVERARADEVVATRDDFLAMVSHDLRSMLGGIALSASLLAKQAQAEGKNGAAATRHTDRVLRFTARMNRLVGDLVDVVSLEAGKLHVEPLVADAVQLVQETAEVFQPSFLEKGLRLLKVSALNSIPALFDHARISQVLANLLSNALKFTPAGGSVTMSVAREGSEVLISVTDTGVGIPEEQVEVVFERFRQLRIDRRGLGLGLYIAKSIIDAHGGRIWVDRPASGGTAVHFTLPDAPDSSLLG
ncbi:MAG: hypothetical protein JWN04_4541 [Myxococcaceae bacterium]|nr:hypothetical protein [Myxococcaceae bacterium]